MSALDLCPNDWERRCRLDRNIPAELAIRQAVEAVEAAGAHPLLTDAVILLQEAKEKVGDWHDRLPYPYLDNLVLVEDGKSVEIDGLDLTGIDAYRILPDGRIASVSPLLWGMSQLSVGRPRVMAEEGAMGGWDDFWHYESPAVAVAALAVWNSDSDPEPSGWHRHPRSGRRRAHGDLAQETARA